MTINSYLKYHGCITGNIRFADHTPEILDRLYSLSLSLPFELQISSSFRSPKHNREVGGSPTSSHLKGVAFDIVCKNSTQRYLLIKAIIECGIQRFGVYKNHIHIDFDDTKEQKVAWYV